MDLHQTKTRLDVKKADLSGSRFDDVCMAGSTFHNVNLSGARFDDLNMSGWRVHNVNLAGLHLTKANLAGVSISECRCDDMTIDGIPVTEMLAAYRAAQARDDQDSGT
ncbi:MAG: pentapeptide repeat-containing protein [Azospirillum sp.]|nr:pentapeptide repeat-containing protein [Azospirillum sp.]